MQYSMLYFVILRIYICILMYHKQALKIDQFKYYSEQLKKEFRNRVGASMNLLG